MEREDKRREQKRIDRAKKNDLSPPANQENRTPIETRDQSLRLKHHDEMTACRATLNEWQHPLPSHSPRFDARSVPNHRLSVAGVELSPTSERWRDGIDSSTEEGTRIQPPPT